MAMHTPGPWVTGGVSDPLSILSADTWEQVAAVNDALLSANHNAQLIAAAPQMLAVLLQIRRMGYADIGDRMMIDAAIARATGGQ
jgi:hypothetical protein